MKNFTYLVLLLAAFCMASCEETIPEPYEVFTIKKGKHSAVTRLEMLQHSTLDFTAEFDASAIYMTQTEENQHDTNKLLGFSGCNTHHHRNSARFGWRWLNNQLEILAYVYTNGERIIEPVGAVALNQPASYRLEVTDQAYHFYLEGFPKVVVPRTEECSRGFHYLLFPYFGGDETAPQDITIKIRRNYQ